MKTIASPTHILLNDLKPYFFACNEWPDLQEAFARQFPAGVEYRILLATLETTALGGLLHPRQLQRWLMRRVLVAVQERRTADAKELVAALSAERREKEGVARASVGAAVPRGNASEPVPLGRREKDGGMQIRTERDVAYRADGASFDCFNSGDRMTLALSCDAKRSGPNASRLINVGRNAEICNQSTLRSSVDGVPERRWAATELKVINAGEGLRVTCGGEGLSVLSVADDVGVQACGAGARLVLRGCNSRASLDGPQSSLANLGVAEVSSTAAEMRLLHGGWSLHAVSTGDDLLCVSAGDGVQVSASGRRARIADAGPAGQWQLEGEAAVVALAAEGSEVVLNGAHARLASAGGQAQVIAAAAQAHVAVAGEDTSVTTTGDAAQVASASAHLLAAAAGRDTRLLSCGEQSKLSATGHRSVVVAVGAGTKALAGESGVICLSWLDPEQGRPRLAVGYVGEGLKAHTWYRVNDQGAFEEIVD
jgi:hypothetical protein